MINAARRHSCHAGRGKKKLDVDAEILSAGGGFPQGRDVMKNRAKFWAARAARLRVPAVAIAV